MKKNIAVSFRNEATQQSAKSFNRFVLLLWTTMFVAGIGVIFGPSEVVVANEVGDAKGADLSASQPRLTKSKGRQLFEQDFRHYEGFVAGGDGLGPMFNEVSCIACHHQGTVGGGGGVKHNVDILSVSERTVSQPITMLSAIHPGFVGENNQLVPSLVLHRYANDMRYNVARENFFTKNWLGAGNDEERLQEMLERRPVRELEPFQNVFLLHTQRNTPALFGAGLIDQIPEDLLRQQAAKEKRFGVKGRVSQVRNNRLGRFGWRAQLPNLKEFVLSACANELGLEVEGHSQAFNPFDNKPAPAWPEISRRDTDAMIQFVSEIKAPQVAFSKAARHNTIRGYQIFQKIGCSECHVKDMGPAKNIFSDLLLHDMGVGLSDPVSASREVEIISRPNSEGNGQRSFFDEPRVVSMYYVGTVTIPQITSVPNVEDPNTDVFERFAVTKTDPRQEWRTPPLWGCADSAPYMHDGRAPNLHEAIRAHAGESRRVRSNYLRLKKDERQDLLVFLQSLRAPEEP